MSDASAFIQQKLASYRTLWEGSAEERFKSSGLGTPGFDGAKADRLIREVDPVLLRGDFDAGVRLVVGDFVTSFNDLLNKIVSRDQVARSFVEKYWIHVGQQTSIENTFRQAMQTLYASINELAIARTAYTNVISSYTSRSLTSGVAGAGIGFAIGEALFPGLGGVVGVIVGAKATTSGLDQQRDRLIQDYSARLQALVVSVDSTWSTLCRHLEQMFLNFHGHALQRLHSEIQQHRSRGSIPATNELVVCPHCGGTIKAAAKLCKHCRRAVQPRAALPGAPDPSRQ
jgi:uncharacterized membrane protein